MPEERERSLLVREDVAGRAEFDSTLTVGRHPLNDLVLDQGRISVRHAAIEWDGDRFRIRDLGSRNGTSVNGRRIQGSRPLSQGDLVRFAGASRWRVERLVPPTVKASTPLRPTETFAQHPVASNLRVRLEPGAGGEGTIHVEQDGASWSLTTGQRFVLLYLLASSGGAWVQDDDLKRSLWGRLGADSVDPSALHKLIHDVRTLLRERGVDPQLIQKASGRTRLALDPTRMEIVTAPS